MESTQRRADRTYSGTDDSSEAWSEYRRAAAPTSEPWPSGILGLKDVAHYEAAHV